MNAITGQDRDPRIVVITNGNYFARLILTGLFTAFGGSIDRVIVITGDYKGRSGLAALRWLVRVTTIPYLVYKIAVMIAFRIAGTVRPRASYDLASFARARGVPVFAFRSIGEEGALRCVEEANPDLLVSVSCPQRISKRVLAAARRGGINIHSSLLPQFAGLAPYYWVLADRQTKSGTTVHYMNEKFDEGHVLASAEVEIAARDSAFGLFRKLALAGGPLLADAARRALDGDPGLPQQKELYSYRSHPDFASYRRLRRNGHRLIRLGELWRALRDS
jgi:folate-dependent phosphoribosylglycinamide formyltransferase PurN